MITHFTGGPFDQDVLHEQRRDVGELSPDDVREAYESDLRAVIDEQGTDAVTAETDVDRETVAALADGESPGVSLEDAAAIQALDPEAPDAETIAEMACEHLLLGMSTAVLDVDAIASGFDRDLAAKEIQQKLERRAPMTLDEFAALEHYIVDQQR